MDSSNLIPGYAVQGFSLARAKMAEKCSVFEGSYKTAGSPARSVLYLSSIASDWIETPIRTIENVALTIINLFGAIVNKGCRKNLNYCFSNLGRDITDVTVRGATIYFPVLIKGFIIASIAISILQPFSNLIPKKYFYKPLFVNSEKIYNKNREANYRIKAIRIHGFERINWVDNCLKLLKDDDKNNKWYKGLVTTTSDGIDECAKDLDSIVKKLKKKSEELSNKKLYKYFIFDDDKRNEEINKIENLKTEIEKLQQEILTGLSD